MKINYKKNIPNYLSVLRIILIPFFIYFYLFSEIKNHYVVALIICIVSSLTDLLDGYIARKYNYITEIGKMLDPFSDKLTQAAVIICLTINNKFVLPLLITLVAREILMIAGSIILLKLGSAPIAAKWWGKLSTAFVFATIIFVLINDIINSQYLQSINNILIIMSCAAVIVSFACYLPVIKNFNKNK